MKPLVINVELVDISTWVKVMWERVFKWIRIELIAFSSRVMVIAAPYNFKGLVKVWNITFTEWSDASV